MDMGRNTMNNFDETDGQSLDSIVAQNDKTNRRRSMPVYAMNSQMQAGSPDSRRLSMMNFGNPNTGTMDNYQFGMGPEGMMQNNVFPQSTAGMQHESGRSTDLAINTHFPGQTSSFSAMAAQGPAYASPMHPKGSMDLDMSPYPNSMSMGMDMDDSLGMMQTEMRMFPPNQFSTQMMDSPINQDFIAPNPTQDSGTPAMHPPDLLSNRTLSNTPDTRSGASGFPSRANSHDQSLRSESEQRSSSSVPTRMSLAPLNQQQPIALDAAQDLPQEAANKQLQDFKLPWSAPPGGFPSTMHSRPHMKTQFKNAYSSTGFDMLGVLVR